MVILDFPGQRNAGVLVEERIERCRIAGKLA
jgi:hypothetical protein